jgi:hypothetical protein
MKSKILDIHCMGSSNFKIYNFNNVILDYARSYMFAPDTISARERASRFQGLSPIKFDQALTNYKSIEDNSVIHNFNDILYVPTHKNFYHMIIDCLPRLYAAKIDSRPVVMCKTYLDFLPTIFPVLKSWFPNTPFTFIEAQKDSENTLSARSLPGRIIGNNIGFYSNDCENIHNAFANNKILAVAFWQQWFKENYPTDIPKRKVFIYRRRGDSVERLSNQEEICEELKKLDFEIVDPIGYSFEEMAKIMNGAKIVIGAHGAGLANAIFCQPEIKYIQLANSSGSDIVFQNFARYCSANYKVIYGLNPETGGYQLDNRHGMYKVDMPSIQRAINQL